jgi:hypothetical protein
MSTEKAYTLRVSSRAFCCGVTIRDGKVDASGTAPYLRRLSGMAEATFMEYAKARGWKIERGRPA